MLVTVWTGVARRPGNSRTHLVVVVLSGQGTRGLRERRRLCDMRVRERTAVQQESQWRYATLHCRAGRHAKPRHGSVEDRALAWLCNASITWAT